MFAHFSSSNAYFCQFDDLVGPTNRLKYNEAFAFTLELGVSLLCHLIVCFMVVFLSLNASKSHKMNENKVKYPRDDWSS